MNEPGVAREAWGRPHATFSWGPPMQLWSAQSKPREGVRSSEGKNLGLTRDNRDKLTPPVYLSMQLGSAPGKPWEGVRSSKGMYLGLTRETRDEIFCPQQARGQFSNFSTTCSCFTDDRWGSEGSTAQTTEVLYRLNERTWANQGSLGQASCSPLFLGASHAALECPK